MQIDKHGGDKYNDREIRMECLILFMQHSSCKEGQEEFYESAEDQRRQYG
jgi:hypothetical protein